MLSQPKPIAVALEALDYATQPWYYLPRSGASSAQASRYHLGHPGAALPRRCGLRAQLAHVMAEDQNEDVQKTAG